MKEGIDEGCRGTILLLSIDGAAQVLQYLHVTLIKYTIRASAQAMYSLVNNHCLIT